MTNRAVISTNDAMKLDISITCMNNLAVVNAVMEKFLNAPYPTRACVAVAVLLRGVAIARWRRSWRCREVT